MANVSYNYPHMYGRFDWDWDTTRVSLNGNYTYPMKLNNIIPECSKLSVKIYLYSDYTVVFDRSWSMYIDK